MLDVEDWAEFRGLHLAGGMPIKQWVGVASRQPSVQVSLQSPSGVRTDGGLRPAHGVDPGFVGLPDLGRRVIHAL
jgi:hypothetical protein